MSKRKFELVVVGAGPAGAMAARTAAELGIDTALIERRQSIADIRRSCTEAIGLNEENFGDMVYYNDKNSCFCFPRNGFVLPYNGPMTDIYGFHIYTPGGNRVMMGDCSRQKKLGVKGRVGIAIDKGILTSDMVKDAQGCQAKVFVNKNVAEIKTDAEGVTITCSDGDEFYSSYVIAADGVNSRIVRLLGVNRKRKFMGTYVVYSCDFEGLDLPDPEAMIMVMGLGTSIALCRRAQAGQFHVSSGAYNPALDLEAGLESFMSEPAFSSWFKNARSLNRRTACVVNMYEPLEIPRDGRVLIAGDAFWRQETGIMGAVMPGRKAATSVAMALLHKADGRDWIEEYLSWYHDSYYSTLGKGGKSMGDLNKILSRDDFDFLASLVTETLPATMKFYHIIKNIGSAFGRMVPEIRRQRPEILKKLARVREMPEEKTLEPRLKAGFANR